MTIVKEKIVSENKITGVECRFVVHVPTRDNDVPDVHLIKEAVHYEDGTVKPNVRIIKNYERPFWITKPSFQNHTSKKESEDIDKLLEYKCTQSSLRFKVAAALGKQWSKDSLKELSTSPYLYGTDITSCALIKQEYLVKYPNAKSGCTVAVYDIETDVVYGTEQIILATIAYKNKVVTVASEFFMSGYSTPEILATEAFNKYLSEYKDKIEFEFSVVKNPIEILKVIFGKAHEWMPDFLAIWNMDYDIPRTIRAIEEAGLDPTDILCDPRVPKEYRKCYYKEGRKKKVTASGKVTPINPSSQWHTLILTASFYVIDSMCTYKHLRTPPGPEEPSYSLDNILKKELNKSKLKFTMADNYTGLKWHEFMQTNYKMEYAVYNAFDCISVLELDSKTKDLSHSLSSFAGYTDFEKFTSNPRKIHDALHTYFLENDMVISSSGSTPYVEIDEELLDEDSMDEETKAMDVLSLRHWIVTLQTHLVVESGLKIISDDPSLKTLMRGYCFDSDCTSAYPSATIGCNVSKATTVKELSSIEGIMEHTFRMQNINLVSGPVNSIEYATTMFGFPKLDILLDEFKKIL